MIRSMTAFARVQRSEAYGTLTWELRSVNHRYLDISMRMPEDFRAQEGRYRELINHALSRGKLEANLRFVPEEIAAEGIDIDDSQARMLVKACQQINDMLHQPSEISAVEILRWPGVVREHELDYKPIHENCAELLQQALQELVQSREAEGARMRDIILQRCEAMQAVVKDVRAVMPEILQAHRDKIKARLDELEAEYDKDRYEQEMVLIAQKMDVDEEMDRLESHFKELSDVLSRDEAIGRRLDFLMQELNREANTLGSKSADIRTTQASVELKVLIEQMREQIQNIE